MHTATAIVMRAPREQIFETTANLENWPRLLPHYRYITYLERGTREADGSERHRVVMAARRGALPIAWTSEQVIDRKAMEVRFTHLKAWTRGMHVVWTYTPLPEDPGAVRVEIVHDMNFRFPPLAPVANPIIGGFFIEHVANQTLRCFKQHLEGKTPVAAR